MDSQIQNPDDYQIQEFEAPSNNDYEQMDSEYMENESMSLLEQPSISYYDMSELPDKIWQEIMKWTSFTCLSQSWTFMLSYFRDFNEERIIDVIDCNSTGQKIIHYVRDYKPKVSFETCEVCCLESRVFSNPCGHSFCFSCWASHLQRQLTESQLFPFCQEDGCLHRMNYDIMALLFNEIPFLKSRFLRLLCYKYCQNCPRVRLCPLNRCQKVLFINKMTDSKIVCECGATICKKCGFNHFPISCTDLSNWKMMSSVKDHQWINSIVMQKCPMCKEPIVKDNGCIHITCRCKHQFCWICLKVWAGHNSYQSCGTVSLEEHENTLRSQQSKRLRDTDYYNQRFESVKSETERLSLLAKFLSDYSCDSIYSDLSKLKILRNEVVAVQSMRQFAITIWELQRYILIYNFFQKEHSNLLIKKIQPLSKFANRIDDFIRKSISEKVRDIQELQIYINNEDMLGIYQEVKKWLIGEINKLLNELSIAKCQYAQFQSGQVLQNLRSMMEEQQDRLVDRMQMQEYQAIQYSAQTYRRYIKYEEEEHQLDY